MEGLPVLLELLLKLVLAVLIGGLIGSERARHGRAAGMRTHILVCLGACLTSMTSLYVVDTLGNSGDIFRIPAQVISGVGFLGAGMIILKNNNMITGLTTAAGVWTTGVIGVAIGYGYYTGAVVVTVLFLITIILFAKFEKHKKTTEVIYVEIDDMYRTNEVIRQLQDFIREKTVVQTVAPKSGFEGHLGLIIVIDKRTEFNLVDLLTVENVVYAVEDGE